jgi:WD40 repeat protein
LNLGPAVPILTHQVPLDETESLKMDTPGPSGRPHPTVVIPGRRFAMAFLPLAMALAWPWARCPAQATGASKPPPKGALIGHLRPACAVAYSPDGRSLASGSEDGAVKIWDLAAAEERFVIRGHPDLGEAGPFKSGAVLALAFSPDGAILASGSADATVRLWDTASGRDRATLAGHSGGVSGVAFAPDGETLASAGGDGIVRLWDPATGRERSTMTGPTSAGYRAAVPIGSLAFSHGGATIAAGRQDGSILLLDVPAGTLRASLVSDEDKRGIARVEEYYRRQVVFKLIEHRNRVSSVAFSPDDRTLASSALDKLVRLWDVNGKEVRTSLRGDSSSPTLQGPTAVVFTRDGKSLIAGGGDGVVRSWDVATARVRGALEPKRGGVRSIALSPDETTLAVATSDLVVTLWDTAPLLAPEGRR